MIKEIFGVLTTELRIATARFEHATSRLTDEVTFISLPEKELLYKE